MAVLTGLPPPDMPKLRKALAGAEKRMKMLEEDFKDVTLESKADSLAREARWAKTQNSVESAKADTARLPPHI